MNSKERRQARLTVEALQAESRYDQQMRATEVGRASVELRDAAHRAEARGDWVGALALYRQAAQRFDAADDSAAAASCWYDLGNALTHELGGVEFERLLEARELAQRALRSPARRSAPRRYAQSLELVARCARRLAEHANDSARSALRAEAEQAFRDAIRVAVGAGYLLLADAAMYRTNYARLLQHRGDIGSAIKQLETALDEMQRAEAWLASMDQGLDIIDIRPEHRHNVTLSLSTALLHRGRETDRKRIDRLLSTVIDGVDTSTRLHATALLARMRAYIDWGRLDEARGLSVRVQPSVLGEAERLGWLQLLDRLGDHERAQSLAVQFARDHVKRRHDTAANHYADHESASAQRFAAVAARNLVTLDNPLAAFVETEHVAALRYLESCIQYGVDLSDPVLRAVATRRTELSTEAGLLDDAVARIINLDGLANADIIGAYLRQLADVVPDLDAAEILTAPQPIEALRQVAQDKFDQTGRYARAQALREREVNARAVSVDDLTLADVEGVLDEYPDLVLLRVRLETPGFAVAVWRGDEGLIGQGCHLECDGHHLNGLLTEDTVDASMKALAPALAPLVELLPLDQRASTLVVLPSAAGARVPWPALETPDGYLIDRFRSIIQLPNLTPLRQRQAPRRLRSGTLAVAPGLRARPPLEGHAPAFHDRHLTTHLQDGAATRAACLEAASTSDVVAFFTHGSYGPLDLGLQVADGQVHGLDLADVDVWIGAERVELWACSSGVNQSIDYLTPLVDEPFGLDLILHECGVRSTIGTLWPVPEYPTALLAREYGRRLNEGMRADEALADAQRWWLHTFLPSLEGCEGEDELNDRLDDWALLSTRRGAETDDGVEDAIARASSVASWAAFRFLGVAERRPEGDPPPSRPLTDDEQQEVERLLERAAAPRGQVASPIEALAAAREEAAAALTPEAAIRIARLYQAVHRGAAAHTALRAMAWLGEALAAGPDAEGAARLRIEVAWCELDLAIGEWPPDLWKLLPAHPLWSRRALGTLQAVGSHPEGMLLNALVLAHAARGKPDFADAAAQVVGNAPPLLDALDPYARTRALWHLTDLVFAADALTEDYGRGVLHTIEEHGTDDPALAAQQSALAIRRLEVARRGRVRWKDFPHTATLNDASLSLSIWTALAQADVSPDAALAAKEVLSEELTILENRYWGPTAQPTLDLLTTTGTPGNAWSFVAGHYVAGHVKRSPDVAVRHLLGCLHLGTDLRTAHFNAIARLPALAGSTLPSPDAANSGTLHGLVRAFEDAVIGAAQGGPDPFRVPPSALAGPGIFPSGWPLFAALGAWLEPADERTAAFRAERLWTILEAVPLPLSPDDALTFRDAALHAGPRSLPASVLPTTRLEEIEELLRDVPHDTVVVGMMLSPASTFTLLSYQNRPDGVRERTYLSQPADGLKLLLALAETLRPPTSELQNAPTPGLGRPTAWRKVVDLLEPALNHVLDPDGAHAPTKLAILNIGHFRALPWAGLHHRGRPLYACFDAIGLLPTLTFPHARHATPNTPTATVRGAVSAATAAVLDTANRRQRGVDIPPPSWNTRDLPEVDGLESRVDWRCIRLMGPPSSQAFVTSTGGVELVGRRVLTPRNLQSLRIGLCEAFEIWTCTTPWTYADSLLLEGGDRLPGLVHAAALTGANGILDLAWFVPDIIRTLCLAAYVDASGDPPTRHPAAALVSACRRVRGVLDEAHATKRLDRRHLVQVFQRHLAAWGFDAVPIDLDDLSDEALTDALDPAHLAAVRWWGWP